MQKLKLVLLLILVGTSVFYSQTQQKIPWPSLADSPWPVARGDVQGTGRSEFVGPKNPEIIWERTYPFGLVTGPVIGEEGNLYFGTFAVNGINENYFYATDSLGNQIWRFGTNSWVANSCAPAVAENGDIYFGSQNYSIYSLSSDGQLNWKHQSNSNINLRNLVLDKSGNIYLGNLDSLYSFDKAGKIRFQKAIPGVLGSTLVFSPSGDTLYVRSVYYDHPNYIYHVYSVSTSGEIFWKREFQNISASIAIDNSNKIYVQGVDKSVTENSALFCLNPDGSLNWYYNEATNANRYDGGPTIDHEGNITYYGNGKLVSVDYNGNFRWSYEFEIEDWFDPKSTNPEHGLVCDAEGTIYIATAWGYYFYAISNEGVLRWKLRLKDYYVTSGPVIGGNGLIYLGMHHGSFANNLENNLWAIGEKTTSVKDEETPTEFALSQNYPNPFNPTTTIKFTIPNVGTSRDLSLRVYDILGREIQTLLNKPMQPGSYEVEFDGSNLSSGVYFYILETGGKRLSKKMLLVK